MAKISKEVLKKHLKAVALLEKEELTFDDKYYIYKHYHEGAGKMNNLISAHFTPFTIANSIAFNVRQLNFVDLCAGIGILSYALLRHAEYEYSKIKFEGKLFTGICVENCVEYYQVGKKLLPELHWINGDIFDQKVIDEIKSLMAGKKFSILSNPPYGKQVKTDTKNLLKYQGSNFEYKTIELGAILGAYDGAFLIPQDSSPFRYSGKRQNFDGVENEKYKSNEYKKFVVQNDLEIVPNIGFSTEVFDEDDNWKDVTITTEIAIVEYNELEYNSKLLKSFPPPPPPINQFNLFK